MAQGFILLTKKKFEAAKKEHKIKLKGKKDRRTIFGGFKKIVSKKRKESISERS